MSVLDNFHDWKSFLGERVSQAKTAGMESDIIENVAFQIGGYLAEQVDPKNDQERLLKQLWDVADESQRKDLASMMVKLVQVGERQ
jgi:hypothetical protein